MAAVQQRQNRGIGERGEVPVEEEQGRGFRGLFANYKKYRDFSITNNFNLGLKRKSVQNESCKTFQALQLCFRVWTQKLKV
jgi:hypothetical protein